MSIFPVQNSNNFDKIPSMLQSEENRRFWDQRYKNPYYEWGKKPSVVAVKALEYIPEGEAVLDVACGYGRDTIFMARGGYRGYGMDFSRLAIERAKAWARQENLPIDFRKGELIDCGYKDNFFGGVIMFNTLHLLWKPKRVEIAGEIQRILKPGGVGLLATFSTREKGFGVGTELEKNTFERGNGRIRHYFSREDIEELFSAFSKLSAEEFYIPPEEHEHQGRKEHGHHEWMIIVEK